MTTEEKCNTLNLKLNLLPAFIEECPSMWELLDDDATTYVGTLDEINAYLDSRLIGRGILENGYDPFANL